jgi:hypothetical protein
MAKKAQPKPSAPKARRKQPVAKKAAPPATSSRAARKPTKPPATSKYDQPGAPWWKKFRPTEVGAAESKR